jgi:hypothetical protein
MRNANTRNNADPDDQRAAPPVIVEKIGSLEAAVWENNLDNGESVLNVTLFRWYFDEEDKQWKKAYSFGKDDLPALAMLATKTTFAIQCLRDQRRGMEKQQAKQEGNGRAQQNRQVAGAR